MCPKLLRFPLLVSLLHGSSSSARRQIDPRVCYCSSTHASDLWTKKPAKMCAASVESTPPIVIPAREKHTATLIFFHGLGDQGHGWADSFRSVFGSKLTNFKFVCPNSASRPVTLNFGMNMPAWYDLKGLTHDSPEDIQGIQAATNYAHCGFSMGAALAIYAGLTSENTLGGVVSLSGFLLRRNELPGNHKANLSIPIFMGHGADDFLVPLTFGQMTEAALKGFNPNVKLHVYQNLDHSSSPVELADAVAFLKANTKA